MNIRNAFGEQHSTIIAGTIVFVQNHMQSSKFAWSTIGILFL